MLIKIPPKKNTASNKADSIGKNPQNATDQPSNSGIVGPFIDKISLVIDPPTDEQANEIYKAVITGIEDKSHFIDNHGQKSGGYNLAKRIVLASVADIKRFPLVQISYDKAAQLVTRLRLEFVPVDLGAKGMTELRQRMALIVDYGWEYVVKNARVTRVDVTVDLPPGIEMDSFHFLPKQSATTTRWTYNGELTGCYFGKSKGSQTKIYNRKAKRLAKGQPFPGPTAIRIERKLINQKKLSLPGLYDLKNPFAGTKMTVNLPPPPAGPKSKGWVWKLFCDSVKVRGLTDALALLQTDQRTKFRKHIAAYPVPWWNPDELWTGWKPMLDELNIAKADIY